MKLLLYDPSKDDLENASLGTTIIAVARKILDYKLFLAQRERKKVPIPKPLQTSYKDICRRRI